MSGIDYFDRGWRLVGDGPFLTNGESGETLSYDEVRTLTFRAANGLHAEGFQPGDKGAVLSTNDAQAFVCSLGLLRAGLAWIPINPRNSVADNAQILDRFDCSVLFYLSPFAEAVDEIRAQAPGIKKFICIDTASGSATGDDPAFLDWVSGYPADPVDVPDDPDGIFALQPTGGTTDLPKGVLMTNRGIENLVANMLAVAPLANPPVNLAAPPLTHASGFLMYYIMAAGGRAVILPKADPKGILEAIPKFGITNFMTPSTLLYMLLAEPGARTLDFSLLEYIFYGAAPTAPEKIREAIKVFGPVMFQIFGQTETMFPNTCLSREDHFVAGEIAPPDRLTSCGRQAPFCKLAIMDEDGTLLPPGEVGELVYRGAGLMLGYYKNPVATAEAAGFGWHHTGDIARMDEDGYVFIVDRKKDMIISGGFNVFSVEVEAAVLTMPAIRDCAVIGAPDEKWGEAIVACVELKAGESMEAEEIIAHCKERLGGVKAPKRVEFVAELPRSAAGKVLKRELRERFWAGRERRV